MNMIGGKLGHKASDWLHQPETSCSTARPVAMFIRSKSYQAFHRGLVYSFDEKSKLSLPQHFSFSCTTVRMFESWCDLIFIRMDVKGMKAGNFWFLRTAIFENGKPMLKLKTKLDGTQNRTLNYHAKLYNSNCVLKILAFKWELCSTFFLL